VFPQRAPLTPRPNRPDVAASPREIWPIRKRRVSRFRMRHEQTLLLAGLFLTACGAHTSSRTPATPKALQTPTEEVSAEATAADSETAEEKAAPVALSYAVGDYIVQRFSLRSHRAPTLLTERVVAVKENSVVLDVTSETGSAARSVRVEMGTDP